MATHAHSISTLTSFVTFSTPTLMVGHVVHDLQNQQRVQAPGKMAKWKAQSEQLRAAMRTNRLMVEAQVRGLHRVKYWGSAVLLGKRRDQVFALLWPDVCWSCGASAAINQTHPHDANCKVCAVQALLHALLLLLNLLLLSNPQGLTAWKQDTQQQQQQHLAHPSDLCSICAAQARGEDIRNMQFDTGPEVPDDR